MTRTVVDVARDLTTIETLSEDLLTHAIHRADDRLMPGGEAMVARAAVADMDEWSELIAYAEHQHMARCPRTDHADCKYAEHVNDEDDNEPPLATLQFWTWQWRGGYNLTKPTIHTEVKYIRDHLDWAWNNLDQWDAFATDISNARTRLENILMAGTRVAFRGVACMYDECNGARLIRKTVPTRDRKTGAKTWRLTDWHCPVCKRTWDPETYTANVYGAIERRHWRYEEDATWTTIDRAARRVGRPNSTVHAWINRGQATAMCPLDDHKRRTWVLMEDVTERDRLARERRARWIAARDRNRMTCV